MSENDNMSYFKHRIGAMNDPRIQALIAEYGYAGYAYYFITLEQMYTMRRATVDTKKRGILGAFARPLDMTTDEFSEFMGMCAELNLFDPAQWEEGIIFSNGVMENIDTYASKLEGNRLGGIKSGEARRRKAAERQSKST